MMSLVHSPEMTPEKIAANRSNARQSRGPATLEGLKHSRSAQLKHGLRSRFFQEAMGLLEEDPEDFERIHQALVKYWQPSDSFREMLVTRLARLMWRLDRGECEQEGFNVRHARAEEVREAAGSKVKNPVLEAVLQWLRSMRLALEHRDLDALFDENSHWQAIDHEHFRMREELQEILSELAQAPDQAAPGEAAPGETASSSILSSNPNSELRTDEPTNSELPEECPSQEYLESAWERLEALIDSEIARVEQEYSVWKRQSAAKLADEWLDQIEAHTSPEVLHRREHFLALGVDRTVRLLRQLQALDQESHGKPSEKKIVAAPSSHDVIENTAKT